MPGRLTLWVMGVVLGACSREPEDDEAAAPANPSRANSASVSSAATESEPPENEDDAPELSYRAPLPLLPADAPANRYAKMSASACRAEMKKRGAPMIADKARAGVEMPVRLPEAMNGVRIEAPSAKSPFGALDCRLALCLDDLTKTWRRLEITAMHIDNMYRPKARVAGKGTPSQHAAGLAVDILGITIDGAKVLIEPTWKGTLETPPCGPGAVLLEPRGESLILRNAVCTIAREGIFHHMLTPSRNVAHEDHLHFDIEMGEKSQLVE